MMPRVVVERKLPRRENIGFSSRTSPLTVLFHVADNYPESSGSSSERSTSHAL